MKRNVNKVSVEFEKMLTEEFQIKCEPKNKTHELDAVDQEVTDKKEEKSDNIVSKNQNRNDDGSKKANAKNWGPVLLIGDLQRPVCIFVELFWSPYEIFLDGLRMDQFIGLFILR